MRSAPLNISGEDIERTADVGLLALRMRSAYAVGMRGVEVPQRATVLREDPFAAFDTMPAYSDRHGLFIAKIGTVVPQSDPTVQSVNAVVVAFCARTGKLVAVLDGGAVTNLKCAAVTALVTDLCASPEASVLGLIGTGVQARAQVRGVGAVRKLEQIRIYSRDPRRVADFIRDNARFCQGAELVACASAREAAAGADILSTATTSTTPVISPEALEQPALHVNCMGNHTTKSRELPLGVLQRGSVLVVEDVATAVLEAGEVHAAAIPIEQLVRGTVSNLQQQRTVFSSTGHAFLDLVTVAHLLEDINDTGDLP
jgi:ornithine cyclodeaminase/alanine dehydrogenase-like protein (mu-crystallin family)